MPSGLRAHCRRVRVLASVQAARSRWGSLSKPAAVPARTAALLADPMQRIRLIQNGHARVEAEFSQAAVCAEWKQLFARFGAT